MYFIDFCQCICVCLWEEQILPVSFSKLNFHHYINHFFDLVFPRDCVLTGVLLESGSAYRYISPRLIADIAFVEEPCCRSCGQPFYGKVELGAVCVSCHDSQSIFENGKTLFIAKGIGREIIHALKYRRAKYILPDIQKILQEKPGFLRFFEDAVLVPVPLFKKRERERGYNQARLIAELFVESVKGARLHDMLVRRRDTQSQTRLNKEQRVANMKDAFAVRYPKIMPSTRRHILVDDVFTTGATVNACAQVLRHAGVARIDVATLAHG